jgi:ferrous iron transport protein B
VAQSFAGRAGHALEPLIKPIGFDWRIGIGLISSFAAREVFVSSMGGRVQRRAFRRRQRHADITPLRVALRNARWPDGRRSSRRWSAFSLMIFYVFAMQCMSTIAVVRRETNSWRWPIFQTAYMTGTAWILSFIVYQSGTALGF